MTRKPRRATTKRRRVIIAVTLLGLLVAAVGVYLVRQYVHERHLLERRVVGMAAYDDGDYPRVLDQLGPYLRAHEEDTEALYAYARARLEVPKERGKHLGEAMTVLRHIRSIEPAHGEVSSLLLQLCAMTEQHSEVVVLAEDILRRSSNDREALRSLAVAQSRLERHEESLAAVDRYLELDPTELQMHLLALDMHHKAGRPAQWLIDHAKGLHDDRPDDPRFKVVLAHAYRLAQDRDAAIQWLRAAAKLELPDALPLQQRGFASLLAAWLDDARLPGEALAYLRRIVTADTAPSLQLELVRRLWEHERWGDIAEWANKLRMDHKQTPTDLLALSADALYRSGESDRADAIVKLLESREYQEPAADWAAWLRARYSEPPAGPTKLAELCGEALIGQPEHAHWLDLQARAYAALGEVHLALDAWGRASKVRPAWAGPRLRSAQLLASIGRSADALNAVRHAALLQPRRLDIAVSLALIWSANLSPVDKSSANDLLKLVERIREEAPGDERLLLLQIALLSQYDRLEEAKQLIAEGLESPSKISPAAWRQIARVSERFELGYTDELAKKGLAKTNEAGGAVRSLAEAVKTAREQGEAEAIQQFDQARSAAGEQDPLAWSIARARLLDHLNDGRAKAAWSRLCDEHSEEAGMVRLALQSEAVLADRALTDRLIKQLQSVTTESGLEWRVERARWLMGVPNGEAEWGEAAVLLQEVIHTAPNHLEARLLRARCLDTLGLRSAAVEELQAVLNQRPEAASVALEAARLRLRDGDQSAASTFLNQVRSGAGLDDRRLIQAASMFAALGRHDDAIDALEKLSADAPLQPTERLLAARLYAQRGQHDKAEAYCQQLLKAPTAAALQFIASYRAERGRKEAALDVLKRLDRMELEPGQREAILASHLSRYEGADAAIEQFTQAISTTSTQVNLRYGLIVALLSKGRVDEAIAQAIEASEEIPDDAVLTMLTEHAALLRRAGKQDHLVPLIAAVITEPDARDDAIAVLNELDVADKAGEPAITTLRKLRQRLDQNPRFLALASLVTRLSLRVGQTEEAIVTAHRAVQTFPDRIEPVILAAEALLKGKRYDEVVPLADAWHRRSYRRHYALDTIAAMAELERGRPQPAQSRLEPYLEQAKQSPDTHAIVLTQYAQSLIAQGRRDQAIAIVKPLLRESAPLRQRWLDVVTKTWESSSPIRDQLQSLTDATPNDAVAERLNLVRAWSIHAQRSDDSSAQAAARQMLAQLVSLADPPAEAWFVAGVFAEQDGQPDQAESHYRAALKTNPRYHFAMNNLAYLLASRKKDMQDALDLSKKAVAVSPVNANYLDTKSYVQQAMGDTDAAIKTMREAIRMEPNELRWQERLRQLLDESE